MVYTVTFNPSLDYIVSVEDFKLGLTNRTSSELILPGGKGLNVSMVLGNLGIGIYRRRNRPKDRTDGSNFRFDCDSRRDFQDQFETEID